MTGDWVIDVGALAAAISAVIMCLGLMARSPVGRGVAQSVTEDLREKRRAEIREEIDEALAPVKHEIFPNDGGSLRDAVDRTACRVDEIGECSDETRRLILTHMGDVDAHRRDRRHDD